jgi:hypothetical protein
MSRFSVSSLVVICMLLGACAAATPLATQPSAAASAAASNLAPPPSGPSVSDKPSAAPSPGVQPLRATGGTAILEPGAYVLDQFPVDLAFDIPDGDPPGWHVGMSSAENAVVLWYTPPEINYGFAFWSAENIYVDPCHPAAGELDPAVGPSVDDLVGALSSRPQFQVTAPVEVTVGDLRGQEIELTALESGDDCPEVIPWTGGDDLGLDPGDSLRVQILDADGVRIVMWTGREAVEPDAAVEPELQQILDSIRVEPLS